MITRHSLPRFERNILPTAPPWAQIIYSAIKVAETPKKAFLVRPFLIYVLHETFDPLGARCVCNRYYRALGSRSTWTVYETAEGWHVDAARFKKLARDEIVNAGGYLFKDDNPPWRSPAHLVRYARKIETLLDPFLK